MTRRLGGDREVYDMHRVGYNEDTYFGEVEQRANYHRSNAAYDVGRAKCSRLALKRRKEMPGVLHFDVTTGRWKS